ncbi:MAG TPA: metallophosphoesterase, partial [Candidatus Acidoferrales bacterium]|nr:metallophosphoesterase [Candidatus Acidoferrales bacterium]
MLPLRRLYPLCLLFVFLLDLAQVLKAQDFSIVVLPDTQNEAQFFPQVMNSQTNWIAANRDGLNIQMVLGVGDIVNDGAQTAQQQNADAAIRILDNAGIPYMLAIGNHDYDGAAPKTRSVTGFNQWFGPARYSGKAYYKGSYPSGSNENFYGILTINGKQYLFLVLEFRPRSAALDWAESILSANPDKEAIVVTHSYLRTVGLREDTCDTQDMGPGNANGQEMWQRLRKHSNVIMVLNGHFTGGSVSHREDVGDNGNLVNQIFADMQDFPNGGDGWLEILTFHPASNTISVQTYSPFLDQYMTGASQQFTVPYHNPNPNTGSSKISGKIRNQSTCAAAGGVTVTAGSASTVTASDGTYSLSVPPGSYSLSASGSGWNNSSQTET